MKKTLLIAFMLILCLSLAACNNSSGSKAGRDASVGDVIQFAGFDWYVLEVSDGIAKIVSVNLLDSDQYNYVVTKMTWEESSIRENLNGFYLDKFFSDEEKALIAETTVVNDDNPWFGTPGGNNTKDKLFLLSVEEVVRYFGDSGLLANRPEDSVGIHDEYSEARIAAYDRTGIDSWWWLRSPGDGPTQAALVSQFGTISVSGFDVAVDDHFPEGRGGIRPALWLIIE